MNARLDNPLTEAGPLLRGMLTTALAVAAIETLLLVRAAVGGGIDHVTVRVDNQAALGLQVDMIDAAGAGRARDCRPQDAHHLPGAPRHRPKLDVRCHLRGPPGASGGHDQGRAGRPRLDGLDPRHGHHRARGGRLPVSRRSIPARMCRLAYRSRTAGGRHGDP
jgi:hypothetical protein